MACLALYKTLILKNAQVMPFACPQQILNFEVLAVFTNQIVGVTIGNYNQNSGCNALLSRLLLSSL